MRPNVLEDKDLITNILRQQRLIGGGKVTIKPLKGGVSSEIYLISEGDHKVVVKRALPKLKVRDHWQADVGRNKTEQAFIRYMHKIQPAAVPELLYSDEDHAFFAMEYIGDSFQNWKQQMLRGIFRKATAQKAASLLANIHRHSWGDKNLQKLFNTTPDFKSLRIEPYLQTTGERHPQLKALFFKESQRLAQHRQALVHGDFSPKNIMASPDRLVLLDHETAWYGDPAFDVAFLLNHLYLKMLNHYQSKKNIRDLTGTVWEAYFEEMGAGRLQIMQPRIGRLLLMLMLARVDGKSPVEYLDEEAKTFVRTFVYEHLPDQRFEQSAINANWKIKLKAALT
jgi:aminoglycoside phosphotransferase (APT) family kinase protein